MAKKKWIQGAIKNPGSFTKQAKAKGLTPAQFQSRVLSNPDNYSATTKRRANLRKTLVKMPDGGIPQYGLGGDVIGGAASGASAGAALGPWGAAVGGVIGGIAGGFAGKKKQDAANEAKLAQQKQINTQKAFAQYEPEFNSYQSMFKNGGSVKSKNNKQPSIKKKFNSKAEAINYYAGIGANAPMLYNPVDSSVVQKNKYTGELLTRSTSPDSYNKAIEKAKSFRNGGKIKSPVKKSGKLRKGYSFNPYTGKPQLTSEMEGWRPLLQEDLVARQKRTASQFLPGSVPAGQANPYSGYVGGVGIERPSRPLTITPEEYLTRVKTGSTQFAMGGNIQQYAMGGEVPVELEGGESFVTPQGEDFNVEGPTHDNGGVPMELPEGTDVFSDRVKEPNSKKTYSELNKQLTGKMSKYESILDDPNSTSIAKKTAEKMLSKLDSEQSNLFVSQERLKQNKEGFTSKYKFEDGGTVRDKITGIINKSVDDLYSKYNTMGYNPVDGKSYDWESALEDKRSRMLGELDKIQDPNRLNAFYNKLQKTQALGSKPQNIDQSEYQMTDDVLYPYQQDLGYSPKDFGVFDRETMTPMASMGIDQQTASSNQLASSYQIPSQQQYTASNLPNEEPLAIEPWMTDVSSFRSQGDVPQQMNNSLTQGSQLASSDVQLKDATTSPQYADSSTNVGDALRGIGGFLSQGQGVLGGISNVAQYAPALYNIGEGLFGKADTLNPSDYSNVAGQAAASRLANRRFNIDPQLAANRRSSAIARRNIAGGARTRGELLSGFGATSGIRGQADASLYSQKQNIENQYGGEAAQMQYNLGMQESANLRNIQDYNARASAAQSNMFGTGLSQLSAITQQGQRNRNLASADAQRLDLLKQMFPAFKNS